jgi:hypothetical protein
VNIPRLPKIPRNHQGLAQFARAVRSTFPVGLRAISARDC